MNADEVLAKTRSLRNKTLVFIGSFAKPRSINEIDTISALTSDVFDVLESVVSLKAEEITKLEDMAAKVQPLLPKNAPTQPPSGNLEPVSIDQPVLPSSNVKNKAPKRKLEKPRRLVAQPPSPCTPMDGSPAKEEDAEVVVASNQKSTAEAGPSTWKKQVLANSAISSDMKAPLQAANSSGVTRDPKKRRVSRSPEPFPCEKCKSRKREELFGKYSPLLAEEIFKSYCELRGGCYGSEHGDELPSQPTSHHQLEFSGTRKARSLGYYNM